jgi:uncharacterized membrane protein YtjA (UPF0391 family)
VLLWAFGFFIAAILAAFFALQEGSAFAGLAQILFWLLMPLVMMALLKPLFRKRRTQLPVSPVVTAPIRGGARVARAAVAPLRPTRPQHSPAGRAAAFLVNAALAALLYAWINNDLKIHAYVEPTPEMVQMTTYPDHAFEDAARADLDADARKRTWD